MKPTPHPKFNPPPKAKPADDEDDYIEPAEDEAPAKPMPMSMHEMAQKMREMAACMDGMKGGKNG